MKTCTRTIITAMTVAATWLSHGAYAQSDTNVLYSADFNISNSQTLESKGFTIIDANGDGKTWYGKTSSETFRKLDNEAIDARYLYPAKVDNSSMDDWLITPSLRLQTGKTYKTFFVMSKYQFAASTDMFEIKLGNNPTGDGMTETIVEKRGLPEAGGNTLWTVETTISVPADGDYYIGIHATGDKQGTLGIVELKLEKGVALITPQAPSDLIVTPDPKGDKKAIISFKAPLKAKDESDLENLSKIEIRRNQVLIATLTEADGVAPGAELSYTDEEIVTNGLYTYSVKAFTEGGGGDAVESTTFIGINTPAPVTDLREANASTTSVTLSWDAPVSDKDGFPIYSGLITYDIERCPLYTSEWVAVKTGCEKLSYTDILPEELAQTEQKFYIYRVTAKTISGSSAPVTSAPVPMGIPYSVPFNESFTNGKTTSLISSSIVSGNNYWSVTTDFEDVQSVDGDNGMIYLNGQIGGSAKLKSGIIDLSGSDSPALSYYTYNLEGCDPADHTLSVLIHSTDGSEEMSIEPYVPANGWNKTIVRLDRFAGKTISIDFTGSRNNKTELFIDNISISTIYPLDLRLTSLKTPAEARTSEPFEIVAEILNAGSEPVGDLTVELYKDGVLADTRMFSSLAVGEYLKIPFEQTLDILSEPSISYSAKVVLDGDRNPNDNISETTTVKVRKPNYPIVNDLSGNVSDGIATLSWSEPDTSKAQPFETTEDFEQYDSWSTSNVGDWIFVDLDKAQIAGFSEGSMPGIPDYSQQSWWIFDNKHEDFNNGSFSTLSGHHFLASMISGIKEEGKIVQNDDWAISPELFGGAQTIIVNARSYSMVPNEAETFEVLYSTGSTDPSDFISIEIFRDITSEWTPYQIELPDGAKRFAIRNISSGKYVLMVDDVTFIPAGKPAEFTINGYNIYRDGIKLNEIPLEENEFIDEDHGTGTHTYNVTTLYAAGESLFSNDCIPVQTGIGTIGIDNTNAVSVTASQGTINVTAPAGTPIEVYTVPGVLTTAVKSTGGTIAISSFPGIYIVNAGATVSKVTVK